MSIYYGEVECSALKKNGESCKNKAYYTDSQTQKYVCGVHCKKERRITLPINPNAEENKKSLIDEWLVTIDEVAEQNRKSGNLGNLTCQKMYMMKNPILNDGVLNIYPNYKHQNRTDGIGYKCLSPKDIGPIHHNQPGLPPALNLENFHQGSKCFSSETDGDRPSTDFYKNQIAMFLDPNPHRHKMTVDKNSKNKNIPEYFVWIDQDKTEHHLTYIESRQFYCNFYERAVLNMDKFWEILDYLKKGYNICICGYDAFSVKHPNTKRELRKTLEKHYLDDSRPFGHELVLYSLLMYHLLRVSKKRWVWRKYKTFEF